MSTSSFYTLVVTQSFNHCSTTTVINIVVTVIIIEAVTLCHLCLLFCFFVFFVFLQNISAFNAGRLPDSTTWLRGVESNPTDGVRRAPTRLLAAFSAKAASVRIREIVRTPRVYLDHRRLPISSSRRPTPRSSSGPPSKS